GRGHCVAERRGSTPPRGPRLRLDDRRHSLVVVAWTKERAAHAVGVPRYRDARLRRPLPRAARLGTDACVAQVTVPQAQRNADRPAGIAGGRLDPDLVEDFFAEDLAVADAVQRHAAGQT